MPKRKLDTNELDRLRTEARALAALHHRHIVPIYEVGEQDGQPYFTLELVEGGSLAQLLRGQPQDPATAAQLVDTLAGAIHYAHEQGIVHRDLKPGNILLQRSEARSQRPETRNQNSEIRSQRSEVRGQKSEDGNKRSSSPDVTPLASDLCSLASDLCPLTSDLCPKIADFGLAKYLHQSSERTQSGAVLGTPSYMAPEKALAKAVGPPADILCVQAAHSL